MPEGFNYYLSGSYDGLDDFWGGVENIKIRYIVINTKCRIINF